MAFLKKINIFKKRKKAQKQEFEKKQKEIKAKEKELKEKKKEEVKEKKEERKLKREIKIAPLVLISPHITEKATNLSEKNQYVFKVFPKATKNQIKEAIKEVYGVDVLKVRIINVKRKRKRVRGIEGWKKGYKKAIVKIKEGQKIEILPR